MNNQNIIIFQFNSLYEIMKEIETDINFNIIKISDEKKLEEKILAYQNYETRNKLGVCFKIPGH